MKALVTAASLGVGAALLALVVAIQQDPLTFTHAVTEPVPRLLGASVVPVAEPVVVETTPEGEAGVVEMKPMRVRAAPRAVAPRVEPPEPPIQVIPAPCVEGEYRLLEEHRGVRLTCPPNS